MAADATVSTLVTAETFDPLAEAARFAERHRGAGAIVSFLGEVRGEEGSIEALVLEHYPGFTEKRIEEIADLAKTRWPLVGIRIVHRVGALAPGEPIVFVAAASAHRRAAFETVDFLMDYLKSEAPFWKKEVAGGGAHWVDPREDDAKDKARWRVVE
jgi:molybdopterin synthase catalytic subunit